MEMTKAFYIVRVKEDWYRLHMTTTHYCLGACQSLESLLNTVVRLTKKYRNENKLLKGLSKMEDGGHISEKTLEVYEQDYENSDYHYETEVSETVKKALDEVKFDTPYHRALKRKFNKKPKDTTPTENSHKEQQQTSVLVARKPRLKKW